MFFVEDAFSSKDNLFNISRNFSFIGIIAIGMTFVIITAGIDLSVGSIMGLTGVICGLFLDAQYLPEWYSKAGYFESVYVWVSIFLSLLMGVILGAAYILWMYKRVVFGEIIHEEIKSMKDLKKFELLILLLLAIPIIFFGFYPEPLINSIEISVTNLIDNYNTNLTQSIAKK